MARIVFHVDMDAFYASVESRDDPRLRGVPLVVGADPRGGRGRGVVCTASYEARAYGIRSAMPISQAYRLAPHATFVRPDFGRYSQASDAVMQVLERYADALEAVGMDEAYLDVTARCAEDWDQAHALALSLQAAVRRETGLSCSIGIAPCKAVAKVATDVRKPHGITRVRPEEVTSFLAPMPVRVLHGCGPKTAAQLADAGYPTVGDVAAAARPNLEAVLGSHGAWLWHVARGEDDRPVTAEHGPRKSRGNETTFMRDEREAEAVQATARELLEEAWDRHARRDARPFATLTVKVRYAGFVTLTRAATASLPYDPRLPESRPRALAAISALLAPLLDGRPVRLVGVRMSGFVEPTGQQHLLSFGIDAGLARPELHRAGLARGAPAGAFDPGGLRWVRLPV